MPAHIFFCGYCLHITMQCIRPVCEEEHERGRVVLRSKVWSQQSLQEDRGQIADVAFMSLQLTVAFPRNRYEVYQ